MEKRNYEGKRDPLEKTDPLETDDPQRRMLLIVDPQIDFITGSLPVPGAIEAMDRLAEYLRRNGSSYGRTVITCDRHPLDHMSFKHQGGPWPSHCVESSVGAAVWPAVMEQLPPISHAVRFLYKGEDAAREEYSIFRSDEGATSMETLLRDGRIEDVDICGLAGDVCVRNTLEDALRLYPRVRYRILEEFTASLDGGRCIREMTGRLRALEINLHLRENQVPNK